MSATSQDCMYDMLWHCEILLKAHPASGTISDLLLNLNFVKL